MKSTVFAGLFAAFVSVVSAQAAEVFDPSTNPIAIPAINTGYPVGEAFDIKWNPTTAGPVKIVLLKGPSTNVVDIGTIVASTPNSGSYSWTPEASLEGTGTAGYGIKIVDIPTGKFQYSVQFGIKNDAPATPEKTGTPEKPTTADPEPIKENEYPAGGAGSVVYSTHTSTVTVCPCTAGVAAPSGTGYITPQVNVTTPEYVVPNVSATQPSEPIYTGAASQVKAGGVMIAAFAVMAAML